MRPRICVTALLLHILGCLASGQPGQPRIGFVYPAGGQVGTSLKVHVAGQFLEGVRGVYISGDGIEAKVVDYNRPTNPMQAQQLRERLAELQRASRDPNVVQQIAQIRRLLATARPQNPTMAEIATIQLQIAGNAKKGVRSLRLYTQRGLTNPLRFCIGDLPEYNEPASTLPQARQAQSQPGPAVEVSLPIVINGQILPGQVDRYVFDARAGQELIAVVMARSLIPYLADGVPGWFQARLALYDPSGRQVAYCDNWRSEPDPVIAYKVQSDGRYTIEIADALYRGREDFVYRLIIGQIPFVADVFPLGCRADTEARFELSGWNLPAGQITVDTKGLASGIHHLDLPSINQVLFAVDDLPEAMCQGDRPLRIDVNRAQVINGRLTHAKQVFEFAAAKGQHIVSEVYARRLGSPLDGILRLIDAAGNVIAVADDFNDPASGLVAHQADPVMEVNLPSDGTYRLELADTAGKAGLEYAYRLRIGPPVQDFQVLAWPSGLTLRPGDRAVLNIRAVRKDGFAGPIRLSLDAGSPLALEGGIIPAGVSDLRVTIAAPVDVCEAVWPLVLQATGRIGDRTITRPVIAVDPQIQAFAYTHLVPTDGHVVYIAPGRLQVGLIRTMERLPIQIRPGGQAVVNLRGPLPMVLRRFEVRLDDGPGGVSIKDVVLQPGAGQLILEASRDVKPGLAGNLIILLEATMGRQTQTPMQPAARPGRIAYLPAIPFVVQVASDD
ncbi:MAG: hypothetical protein QHH07_07510 [Sedimentisphaerales bacterium]|nr:hypothetical protein [Sedimentisphaerales bacterium]